jgi:hypothetical protein
VVAAALAAFEIGGLAGFRDVVPAFAGVWTASAEGAVAGGVLG